MAQDVDHSQTLKELIDSYRRFATSHDTDELSPLCVNLVVAFFEHVPVPAWIKYVFPDGSFRMAHVNQAYAELVGVTQEDYAGQLDSDIWDLDTSLAFHANDQEVVETRSFILTDEHSHDPRTGATERWLGWKWPIIIDGRVVAVCGVAAPAKGGFGRGRT